MHPFVHYLPHRSPATLRGAASLEGACNTRLSCLHGSAWITVDGEQRDIVLEAGESFVIDSNRKVLVVPVHAGEAFEMSFAAGSAAVPCSPRGSLSSLRARLHALLPSMLGGA